MEYAAIIKWLKEGDPAISWQVMQDLENQDFSFVFKVRRRMSSEGWAFEIMRNQNNDGTWGTSNLSLNFKSTLSSLLLLKRIGFLPNRQTTKGLNQLLKEHNLKDGGVFQSKNSKSANVLLTSILLTVSSYFVSQDEKIERLLDFLIDNQREDGSWSDKKPVMKNINKIYDPTFLAMEALLGYREVYDRRLEEIRTVQKKSHEFLLNSFLEIPEMIKTKLPLRGKLSVPFYYKYNILAGLNYYQNINYTFDDRFLPAIELLNNQQKNDRWKNTKSFTNETHWFNLEDGRKYSRWITLQALQINKWWKRKSKAKI